ncbi:MAG TPA: amino acid adenylation domain-containing protein, partial [Longimicrobiaceae bacterium]|nr:amino acid adenylation domain-containing protein [Longimicrobiaceae bacterium]
MSEGPQAFPVSYAQQRLWLLEQLAPNTPRYSLGGAVRIDAAVDARLLSCAAAEIIRRHEALRSTFRTIDGEPFQVVHASFDLTVGVDDLRALDAARRESESVRLVDSALRRPFDLVNGPLVRLRLVRLADDSHLLVLAMHHIISDGWSVGVFLRELTTLYRAFAAGRPSPLPPLPVQYVDYAIWQREWLASGTLARQMDYWRRQLSGVGVLELPTDRPRPAEPTFRGARHRFTLPTGTASRVRALCAAEGVTPFIALLATFTVLLHRYAEQDDVVLGTPVAGRNRPELEELVGFFVNTLVLRIDLSGNPTFREVLHRGRSVALAAWDHQDAPFEKLVEELRPERDPTRNPFFQVTFQLQQFGTASGSTEALPARTVDVDTGSAAFDLSVDLWEEGVTLAGRIEYSTDLFEAATIARMARQYALLLDRLCAAPGLRLGEVSLLSEEEWAALLDWNRIGAEPAPFISVQQRFRAAAARAPDREAVRDGPVPLTYAALAGRAGGLSARLRAAGAQPGAVVAVRLPRSADLVAAMLAVLDAGAAYLPLDPAHPGERAARLMADAGARFVLTSAALAGDLPPDGAAIIVVDAAVATPDPVPRAPDDLAYLVYTSGSTGAPKGCLIPHGALSSHCDAVGRHYGFTPADRVLQFASPAFDVAAEEIFPALANGAAVCVCPARAALDLAEFDALVRREGITVLNLPPDFWQAWLNWMEETGVDAPPGVRLLVVGSAAVPAQAMARWRRLAGGEMRVCNAYGVSEATITSTLFDVPAEFRGGTSPTVPIGRPIANTSVWLLDHYRQPVPAGVPGELHLGGAGLASGYAGAPELTAESFFEHTFSDGLRLRLYRTGDRARQRVDGTVESLGRVDEQISLRGFRIEPEEVEAALEAHASVERAAVIAAGRGQSEAQLVAWVVARPGASFQEAELRSFLSARVPRYMVPAIFAPIDALPLAPGGKVDRRALRARPVEVVTAGHDGEEPATPAEALLARIWAEVLGLPRVGLHDNFFALGGDSILSIRMLSRAAQAGLRLSPTQIFQHQTVAELAAVSGADVPRPADAPIPDREPFALLPVQAWFFAQGLVHPQHYNQSLLLALGVDVDADLLDRALAAVVV